MTHKVEVHRIFLALLTDLVQQMLKLHRAMDAQLLRCRSVLGAICDEDNLILSSQFAEAAFAGTWRARRIGSDSFIETGNTGCVMYLWASLQNYIIMQGYIELDFIAHPEVSSVVMEHMIQTCVPMAIQALKSEMIGFRPVQKHPIPQGRSLSPRWRASQIVL
jgi:hypothetical protein